MIGPSRRGWIAPGVALGVFFVLLWQVLADGVVTRVDVHVRNGIQHAAHGPGLHWLVAVGHGCADLGDQWPALLCLVLVTAFVACRRRSWRPLVPAVGALLVLASVIPLKLWVARPGPSDAVLGNADLGFFPSGHTADALCCYGMSAFLLGSSLWRTPAARRGVGGAAVLLVALTAFGLLWSNYHWLSDVVGSLCWCGAWLLLIAGWTVAHAPASAESDRATARL